jgi:hypothetical protein
MIPPFTDCAAFSPEVGARLRSAHITHPPKSWAGATNSSDAIRNNPVRSFVETSSGIGSRLMPRESFDGEGGRLVNGMGCTPGTRRSNAVESYLGTSHRAGSPRIVLGVFRGASRGFDTKTGTCLLSGSLIRPQQSDRAGISVSIQLARGVKAPSLFVCPPTALQCSGERVSKSFECVLHDVVIITHGALPCLSTNVQRFSAK